MKHLITSLLVVSLVLIFSISALAGPQPHEGYESVTLTVESRGLLQEGGQLQDVYASGTHTRWRSDLTSVSGLLPVGTDWSIQFQMYVVFDGSSYTYEFPTWQSNLTPSDSWWQNYNSNSFTFNSSITNQTHQHVFWYGQGQ